MKKVSDIYEQEKRVSNLLWHNSTTQIKRVHPETGGSLHLTHNWGNEEATKILQVHQDRQSKLYHLFQKHYHVAFCAQYPNHSAAKR